MFHITFEVFPNENLLKMELLGGRLFVSGASFNPPSLRIARVAVLCQPLRPTVWSFRPFSTFSSTICTYSSHVPLPWAASFFVREASGGFNWQS